MSRLTQWLAGGPGGAEAAVERTLQHNWPWPPWVSLALILLAVAVVLYCYRRPHIEGPRWRRIALPALRVATLLLLLTMMYGWSWQQFRTDLPDLLLVIDDSASMLHADGPGDESRFQRVRQLLLQGDAELLRRLREDYRLRLFLLADRLREVGQAGAERAVAEAEIDADAVEHGASRLGDGVAQLLRQQRSRPAAAILMLTDGVTTVGQPLADAALDAHRRGTPLALVGVGDDRRRRDLRLAELVYQRTVFPGDLVQLDAKLFGPGLAGEQIAVRMSRQGELVGQQQVTIPERGAAPVRIAYRAETPGVVQLELAAEPLAGELNPDNNRLTAELTVRDETIRVLMLQHHPSFDYQFLKMLLGRGVRRDRWEEAFSLTAVLQDSDPEYAAQDADAARVFPASRDELMSYDIVILGDADPAGLSNSQMELLVDFVAERGGAVVLLSGPRHSPLAWRGTPLEELMPIDLSSASLPPPEAVLTDEMRPLLTPLGADLPHLQLADDPEENQELWQRMPPLYWFVQTGAVRQGVRVLLEHPTRRMDDGAAMPIVCSQFFGAGMVLLHATDESYRWSAHPTAPDAYARYWLQTLRHLGRGKLAEQGGAELSTDAESYRLGAPVRLLARFWDESLAPAEDDGVLAVVEGDGRRRRVRLQRIDSRRGHFQGVVEGLSPGSYRGWLAAPAIEPRPAAAEFQVSAPQQELTRLRMNSDELRRAAELSGGAYAPLEQLDELLDRLPAGRQPRLSPLPPRPLWNSNLLAALVVLSLTAEWLLRRRSGLS